MFKQDLFFEVKRALNNIDKSLREFETAKTQAELDFKSLKPAAEKYKQKQVHYTALHSAGDDFIEAEENYIEALFSCNLAVIQAETAMHIRAADIQHKPEHAMRHHAGELLNHLNKALACREEEKVKYRHKELEEDL